MIYGVRSFLKNYGVAALLCVVTLFLINRIFKTVCFSVLFFGIPCPACGITRATRLLLTGHIKESFQMHPLLILVIFSTVFCLFIKKKLKKSRFFINLYVIICILIFIGYYIYRMNKYFPNVEPLLYRENNVLEYLYKLWGN